MGLEILISLLLFVLVIRLLHVLFNGSFVGFLVIIVAFIGGGDGADVGIGVEVAGEVEAEMSVDGVGIGAIVELGVGRGSDDSWHRVFGLIGLGLCLGVRFYAAAWGVVGDGGQVVVRVIVNAHADA